MSDGILWFLSIVISFVVVVGPLYAICRSYGDPTPSTVYVKKKNTHVVPAGGKPIDEL